MEEIHLPTVLKIFWRFWWEWSSGKFSATTVRDCKRKERKKNMRYATM